MSLKSKPTYVDNDKVRKLFEKYDLNKNGVIDPDEFMTVMMDILKQLGEELPEKKDIIDLELASKSLERLKVDELGLDEIDIEYLESLIEKFNGGPVGVETIATSIGEEPSTLEDVVEPYLLQEGFIKRTRSGRVACEKAYDHLKINHYGSLF